MGALIFFRKCRLSGKAGTPYVADHRKSIGRAAVEKDDDFSVHDNLPMNLLADATLSTIVPQSNVPTEYCLGMPHMLH